MIEPSPKPTPPRQTTTFRTKPGSKVAGSLIFRLGACPRNSCICNFDVAHGDAQGSSRATLRPRAKGPTSRPSAQRGPKAHEAHGAHEPTGPRSPRRLKNFGSEDQSRTRAAAHNLARNRSHKARHLTPLGATSTIFATMEPYFEVPSQRSRAGLASSRHLAIRLRHNKLCQWHPFSSEY